MPRRSAITRIHRSIVLDALQALRLRPATPAPAAAWTAPARAAVEWASEGGRVLRRELLPRATVNNPIDPSLGDCELRAEPTSSKRRWQLPPSSDPNLHPTRPRRPRVRMEAREAHRGRTRRWAARAAWP